MKKKLRRLINEAIRGFHWAQKPGYMKDKIKGDPNVDQRIKDIIDEPDSTSSAFELTRIMDPTGEYGKELDQHDHAYLSSNEYAKMQKEDEQRTSDTYRLAQWKELINDALDESGLRSGLDNLSIDISMHKQHNETIAGIRSKSPELKQFKEYLDQGGIHGHFKGRAVQTHPKEMIRYSQTPEDEPLSPDGFYAFYAYPI